MYSNLLLLGVKIDMEELDAEMMYYLEYFGMKRRSKEEEERFKALSEIIKRVFGK